MRKWVGFVAVFSFVVCTAPAFATPITEESPDLSDQVNETLDGIILDGHDDAYTTYDTTTVTTVTGYIVPGSSDQFYTPTTEELAGTDCSSSDDLDEALWALILDLDGVWLFL